MATASPAGPAPTMATSTFTVELDLREGHCRPEQVARHPDWIHRVRRFELAAEESAKRFAAAQLSARCSGQGSRLEEEHGMRSHPGRIQDRLADPLREIYRRRARSLGEDQELLAVRSCRRKAERRRASGPHSLYSVECALELLWLV